MRSSGYGELIDADQSHRDFGRRDSIDDLSESCPLEFSNGCSLGKANFIVRNEENRIDWFANLLSS